MSKTPTMTSITLSSYISFGIIRDIQFKLYTDTYSNPHIHKYKYVLYAYVYAIHNVKTMSDYVNLDRKVHKVVSLYTENEVKQFCLKYNDMVCISVL